MLSTVWVGSGHEWSQKACAELRCLSVSFFYNVVVVHWKYVCCILQKKVHHVYTLYCRKEPMTVDSSHSPFFSISGRNLFFTEIDDKSSQNSPAASVMVPGYEDDYVIIGSCSPSPIAICLLTKFVYYTTYLSAAVSLYMHSSVCMMFVLCC